MSEDTAQQPPTAWARRFVRYVGGFSVGIGVGLAPFLGKLPVPGFDALLSLFPRELQGTVIPLSAFLMGLVAIASQFYSGEPLTGATIRKRFRFSLIGLLTGLLLLIVLHSIFIVNVPALGGDVNIAVTIVGERDPKCGCDADTPDRVCIQEVTLKPGRIDSCWDPGKRRQAELVLSLCYLWVTTCFAILVGLLMIQEQNARRKNVRHRDDPPPSNDR